VRPDNKSFLRDTTWFIRNSNIVIKSNRYKTKIETNCTGKKNQATPLDNENFIGTFIVFRKSNLRVKGMNLNKRYKSHAELLLNIYGDLPLLGLSFTNRTLSSLA
jgi:hypothetical protein